MKHLRGFVKHYVNNRALVTTGLKELYSDRIGAVGDYVIIKLGPHWAAAQGQTYLAKIRSTTPEAIRVDVLGNSFPDDDALLVTRWDDSQRSSIFFMPEGWLTHDDPVTPPAEPEKTLFAIMCEYDSALATLQSLKPGYDEAHERFINARVALGAALAKHKDL